MRPSCTSSIRATTEQTETFKIIDIDEETTEIVALFNSLQTLFNTLKRQKNLKDLLDFMELELA